MKIFEIEAAIERAIESLLDSVNEETGEVDQQKADELEALKEEREKKLEGVGCYIKNLDAEIDALKAEEDKLKKRRKTAENKRNRLCEFLKMHIPADEKIKSPRVIISFRKSAKVEITNEEDIPAKFCELVYETKIDKVAITKAIKEGEAVSGCELVESYNLQIK